jgi:hypothetical protein
MRPHIYLLRGQWTCAHRSGGWTVWPYGKGDTPLAAYEDWKSRAPPVGTINVRIGVRIAWWFLPYAALLKALAIVTRRIPGDAHIERMAYRAVRTKLFDQPEV